MEQYDRLAGFYDKVISGKEHTAPYVISVLKKYHPRTKTLLELGCGTGDVLAGLAERFELTGIDSSAEMLRIARKKLPSVKYFHGDIRYKLTEERFDAVICVYDTLNHITLFNQWKKVFSNAEKMLNENGVFIFDVNSAYKLNMLSRITPLVHRFEKNFLIMDVDKRTENLFNWNLKVFENTSGDKFRLTECNIPESAFDIERISESLRQVFILLRVEDEYGKRVNSKTERIYFICRKK